jgi:hypothetical protein
MTITATTMTTVTTTNGREEAAGVWPGSGTKCLIPAAVPSFWLSAAVGGRVEASWLAWEPHGMQGKEPVEDLGLDRAVERRDRPLLERIRQQPTRVARGG